MRLMSFKAAGRESFGLAVGAGVVDAGRRLQGTRTLRDALLADSLPALRRLANEKPDFSLDEVEFLPPVADTCKLLCIGINYVPHMKEMGRERPEYPVVFVRFADSIVGHGRPLLRPLDSVQLDYEGELAVVIGRRARRVTRAAALDYVAGYACFNDGSVRDYQRHSQQFTPGKNFHASGSFGPYLVTADEVPDARKLRLTTRLNGEAVQDESVGELCFDVAQLIEYCSKWAELLPGDVIVTGTPGGVGAGRKPPLWMKAGDTVEVEISNLGVLRNSIADETPGAGSQPR
jgi:2-keto-4-pentenoate hydratase/2-oxohepta-3-ene-1,7-dioic acid hydratase in catechol pathway